MEEGLESTQDVTTAKQPMWVKIVFRIYALFLFGLSLLSGVTAVRGLLLFANTQERSSLFGFELLLFIYVFLIFLSVFQITFAISIFKSKRWTIPLILIFATYTLLYGTLRLVMSFYQNEIWILPFIVSTILMSLLVYAGVKFQNTFEGPKQKLFLQVPLVLLSLPLALFAVLQIVFVDDKVVNDSDLLLPPVQRLSDNDNAYSALPRIKNLSAQEKEQYEKAFEFYTTQKSTKIFNTSEAQVYVNAFANVTDSFINASTKQGYQCPVQENVSILEQGCSTKDVRDIAILVALRASTEAHTGKELQAVENSMSIIRLGYKLGNIGQPTLVEHLVGIALMRIGMESLEQVIPQTETLPVAVVEKTQDELSTYLLDGSALATSFKREYVEYKLLTTQSLPQEYKTNSSYSYFYQKNKTQNSSADFYRKQIEVIQTECGEDFIQKQERLNAFVEKNKKLSFRVFISPNSIGKILTSVFFASMSGPKERECELNELNQSLQNKLQNKVMIETGAL